MTSSLAARLARALLLFAAIVLPTSLNAQAVPGNTPLKEVQVAQEAFSVADQPPAWVERVLPYVTVYGAGAQVNILDAPPLVLAAVGIAPEQVNAVLAQRDRSDFDPKALMQALGALKAVTVEPSKAMRVSVVVQFDGGVRSTAEIVILLGDDADEPYRVLSWRDDFDQIAPAGA